MELFEYAMRLREKSSLRSAFTKQHSRSWAKSYSAKRFLELFLARGGDVR